MALWLRFRVLLCVKRLAIPCAMPKVEQKKQEIYSGNTSLYKSLALLTAFKPGCSPHVLLKKKTKKKHEDGLYKLQGRI